MNLKPCSSEETCKQGRAVTSPGGASAGPPAAPGTVWPESAQREESLLPLRLPFREAGPGRSLHGPGCLPGHREEVSSLHPEAGLGWGSQIVLLLGVVPATGADAHGEAVGSRVASGLVPGAGSHILSCPDGCTWPLVLRTVEGVQT